MKEKEKQELEQLPGLTEEDMELLADTVVLTDENDEDIELVPLDVIHDGGRRFLICVPVEEAEKDDMEALVLEIKAPSPEDDPDDEIFESVDDDDLADSIFTQYIARHPYDFEYTE